MELELNMMKLAASEEKVQVPELNFLLSPKTID